MSGYPETVYVVHVTAPFFGRAWEERPTGYSVRYDMHDEDAADRLATLEATIAHLTAELAQALAETAAAYERAADKAVSASRELWNDQRALDVSDDLATLVRALATEPGTTALAEMLDAETRACAEVAENWWMNPQCERPDIAILARIDQRKEG